MEPRPVEKGKPVFERVLLKLSGEGLAGPEGYGIHPESMNRVAREIIQVHEAGVQMAVVVGGGNILRGKTFAASASIGTATAHEMGMLATIINGLAMQDTLVSMGIETRLLSSVPIAMCEPFRHRLCIRHLEKGRIVLLAGGTGRPFVTTDTAAALAAVEIGANALLKATQVDGVYNADPNTHPEAVFYPHLSYDRAINERLGVMDISAVELCQRNEMPILVFNLHQPGNMNRIVRGERIGTIISTSQDPEEG